MAIKKKLIHFATFEKFNKMSPSANRENTQYLEYSKNNYNQWNINNPEIKDCTEDKKVLILYHSIVFILDELCIWTHGKIYKCNDKDNKGSYITTYEGGLQSSISDDGQSLIVSINYGKGLKLDVIEHEDENENKLSLNLNNNGVLSFDNNGSLKLNLGDGLLIVPVINSTTKNLTLSPATASTIGGLKYTNISSLLSEDSLYFPLTPNIIALHKPNHQNSKSFYKIISNSEYNNPDIYNENSYDKSLTLLNVPMISIPTTGTGLITELERTSLNLTIPSLLNDYKELIDGNTDDIININSVLDEYKALIDQNANDITSINDRTGALSEDDLIFLNGEITTKVSKTSGFETGNYKLNYLGLSGKLLDSKFILNESSLTYYSIKNNLTDFISLISPMQIMSSNRDGSLAAEISYNGYLATKQRDNGNGNDIVLITTESGISITNTNFTCTIDSSGIVWRDKAGNEFKVNNTGVYFNKAQS